MEPLSLPLDYAAIEKILPHRYPFLLVDRIIELEVDKRIVGIKNISSNERYLTRSPDGRLVLPPTILTESIAQVGAIMILAKPENSDRLPFFAGIERVRYRRPVHPGDVVTIEVVAKRLRTRMGVLAGKAIEPQDFLVKHKQGGTRSSALLNHGPIDLQAHTPLDGDRPQFFSRFWTRWP